MALDPYALVQRVLQQVLAALTGDDGFSVEKGDTPEEQLADAIGNLIAQMLGGEDFQPADAQRSSTESYSDSEYANYDAIIESSRNLASALGNGGGFEQPTDTKDYGGH